MTPIQDTKYKIQDSGGTDPLGEKSFQFSLDALRLVRNLPNDTAGRVVGTQFLRAATSIGANVAEARGGKTRNDFAAFLSHALKSGQ